MSKLQLWRLSFNVVGSKWEPVSVDALREIMPYNDRIMELIEKMSHEDKSRQYGGSSDGDKYSWRVTDGESPE